MPRPARIKFENAWYHVMNRGSGRRRISINDEARVLFSNLLAAMQEDFRLEIHAYCPVLGSRFAETSDIRVVCAFVGEQLKGFTKQDSYLFLDDDELFQINR